MRILIYLFLIFTTFWPIVDFILYLFTDKAFNWWSVRVFFISIILVLISVIYEIRNKENRFIYFKEKYNLNKINFN